LAKILNLAKLGKIFSKCQLHRKSEILALSDFGLIQAEYVAALCAYGM